MAKNLSVPFSAQQKHGYCLLACAQMALAHLGISRSQSTLASELGIFEDFGVPSSNIRRLKSSSIEVIYATEATLSNLAHWLEQKVPVIAFVHTAQLDYWQNHPAQHAVLLVAIDNASVYLLDPARNADIVTVAIDEFLLAWDEMEFSYAVIYRRV